MNELVTVELSNEQLEILRKPLFNEARLHSKEVRFAPEGSFYLGYEFEPYGDRSYFLTREGDFVSTYFSIGD